MLRRKLRRLVSRAAASAPQVIEANVCDDAIHPGVKTALETKTREILVDFQEGFLVDVARILRPSQNIQRDAQDVAVVTMDKFFKGFAISALCAFNQAP